MGFLNRTITTKRRLIIHDLVQNIDNGGTNRKFYYLTAEFEITGAVFFMAPYLASSMFIAIMYNVSSIAEVLFKCNEVLKCGTNLNC